MKQKDTFIIIFSVIVASIFSYILCNTFIGGDSNRNKSAEIVTPIVSEFKLPDKKIFNSDAVNPTKQIEIGPNTNNQPFANQ